MGVFVVGYLLPKSSKLGGLSSQVSVMQSTYFLTCPFIPLMPLLGLVYMYTDIF